MRTVRQYLVLVALMFWLGGFTFYASIVVPIGTEVLGSPHLQGFVTREVTRQLNITAILALLPLLWDVLAEPDSFRWRWRIRLGLWMGMVFCQVFLFLLHGRLDEWMRRDEVEGIDEVAFQAGFRPLHRLYLWTHTIQWFFGLLYIALMLRVWQGTRRERKVGRQETKGEAQKVPPLTNSASPSHRNSHTAEQN